MKIAVLFMKSLAKLVERQMSDENAALINSESTLNKISLCKTENPLKALDSDLHNENLSSPWLWFENLTARYLKSLLTLNRFMIDDDTKNNFGISS